MDTDLQLITQHHLGVRPFSCSITSVHLPKSFLLTCLVNLPATNRQLTNTSKASQAIQNDSQLENIQRAGALGLESQKPETH